MTQTHEEVGAVSLTAEAADKAREFMADENLSAEDLMYWQRRAFREWAFRPGPVMTYLKMLMSDRHTFKRAFRVGLEHLGWAVGRS